MIQQKEIPRKGNIAIEAKDKVLHPRRKLCSTMLGDGKKIETNSCKRIQTGNGRSRMKKLNIGSEKMTLVT